MTIAWFRATPLDAGRSLKETDDVIRHLSASHRIRVITSAEADDFVWRDHHEPVTLCVFELSDDPGAAFVWPYLFRFPGLLIASGCSVHNARAAMLERQARHDDYRAEFLFNEGHLPPDRDKVLPRGSWPMLRAAVTASKLTVVRHEVVAERLRERYPGARIVCVPLGCDEPADLPPEDGSDQDDSPGRGARVPPEGESDTRALRCAVYGDGRLAAAAEAAARAGTRRPVEVTVADGTAALPDCDVVLALTWPAHGESIMPAIAAMAARRPVVVFETEVTAGWPTVDPQTWQPRGPSGSAPPIAISIDPRDEEHSLMLALKRLSSDPAFARTLAEAGHGWWSRHAMARQTLDAWERVIAEAAALPVPPKPDGWPAHLEADGLDETRKTLRDFGVTVDFVS